MIDMAEFFFMIGVGVIYVAGMIIYDILGKKD